MKRKPKVKKQAVVPASEFSDEFVQAMCDRMGVSFFKYGKVKDAFPSTFDALKSLQQRLDKYRQTGNTEYLVDAANFAMIEFMHPSIAGAEFTPTDSDGSPGRTKKDGTITVKHNLDVR